MSARFLVPEGPNGVGKTTASLVVALLCKRGVSALLTSRRARSSGTSFAVVRLGYTGARSPWHARPTGICTSVRRSFHDWRQGNGGAPAGTRSPLSSSSASTACLSRRSGIITSTCGVPDRSFYLDTEPDETRRRLLLRERRSRLELACNPEQEAALYENAFLFLKAKGWQRGRGDGRMLDALQVAEYVLSHVL